MVHPLTNSYSCEPPEAAGILYSAVVPIVKRIVMPKAMELDSSRTGGWFTCWRRLRQPNTDNIGWGPLVGLPVGWVSPDRFLKYTFFATEKAARLAGLPNDISSWQSRNDSASDRRDHKYGGAIRCGEQNDLIFSFSGFSEHEDEMVCFLTAITLGVLTDPQGHDILAASDNEPLREYFRSH